MGFEMMSPGKEKNTTFRTPRRALVVDSKDRSSVIEHVLAEMGFEIEIYKGCGLSYGEFAHNDFPLVLFWMDSECDAAEFARVSSEHNHTAFIGLSETGKLSEAVEAIRLGMKDYLVMPEEAESLNAAITEVFAEVDKARFQDDTLCMVTHDLKIPLSSIIGYSDIILDRATEKFHPNAAQFSKTIHANGIKMLNLIDNFLMTCNMTSSQFPMNRQTISIPTFIAELTDTFRGELECHHLNLNVEISDSIQDISADESLLFRAVGNMLSNACKYAPPHSDITFKISLSDTPPVSGKQNLIFEVSNGGEGLTEEDSKHVFDKFHRGGTHGCIKGCGIGMFVLKTIIEAHGGKVFVKSVPNQLTTFTAQLPMDVNNAV